jgi:hypothetical protein
MVEIYRVFYPTIRQYTFFSVAHRTFSKIDHILGCKASLNKFKKIKRTLCIISDCNRIKLDLNNQRNQRKFSNTWRLNNTQLKNQCVTAVIRGGIKKFLESSENENTTIYQKIHQPQPAKAVLKGKFIATSVYINKAETSQMNNLMMYLKLLEKQEQTTLQTSRRREIIKSRVGINKMETKQTIQRISETESWLFEKINKINKPLANMTKQRRETPKLKKSEMKKGT